MAVIKSGENGNTAKVNNNQQMYVYSETISTSNNATDRGESYTLTSGKIDSLASATEHAVFYFYNAENQPFHVTGAVISLAHTATLTTAGDAHKVEVLRNPTAGTLISAPSGNMVICNRNFASTNSPSSSTLAYYGATGKTMTDGVVHASTLMPENSDPRDMAIDELIPKGSAIGFTITTPSFSAGTTSAIIEMLGYFEDVNT